MCMTVLRNTVYSLPVDDAPYATVNHETASNYSRPSRVKRYLDSDSDISFPGSAGQHYSSKLSKH